MLVMLICIIVGAVLFRWLQDEEKLFGEILDVQKEKLNWFTVNGKKMAFEAISETYRQEIEKVYNFLLECDSGIYALEYYNRNKDNFEKYGAEVK